MMRLFDKVVSQCNTNESKELLRHYKPTVLCADAIAEHYAMDNREWWGPEDYPYATPPWKSSFVEWREPAIWKMEKNAPLACAGDPLDGNLYRHREASQCGVILTEYEGATAPEFVRLVMSHNGDKRPARTHKTYWCTWFLDARGRTLNMSICGLFFLDIDGTVVGRIITGPGLANLSSDQIPAIERMLDSSMHIVWLSFTFANCCNVKLEDVTEDLQPPEKIRRRLKLPEVKRYTLNIAGHVRRPSREYNEGPQGVMPFHLCRGHFATYTPEKPMFGNPKLVGRYWHPPHMRGKKENGEIIKDYAIQG